MATICCQEKTLASVQAVLFDKDGTLANVESYLKALGFARSRLIAQQVSPPQRARLEKSVLAAFGLSAERLDPAGLLAVGSRYDNEIAAAVCLSALGWGWVVALKTAKAAFSHAEAELSPKVQQTPMLSGVKALLQRLKATGVKIGIVSSDLHSEVAAFVDYYQLHEVDWYCGASSNGVSLKSLPKTHPDFLRFACQALGADPTSVIVVGDSAADYALATQGAGGFLGMTGGWSEPPSINFMHDDRTEAVTFSRLAQVEAFN